MCIETFLLFLTVIDGRTRKEVCLMLGISRATFKRYLLSARRWGVSVEYQVNTNRYELTAEGPFDITDLAWQAGRVPAPVAKVVNRVVWPGHRMSA